MRLLLPLLALGCSEYGLRNGVSLATGPKTRDAGATKGDTAAPADTGFAPPTDTGQAPVPDVDTGSPPVEEDGCYADTYGYELNEAAKIITLDATTPVTVTLTLSDTAYQDELWIDSPDNVRLAQAWVDPIGTSLTLGPYAADTEIVFAVSVQTTGDYWRSGSGTRNKDGVVHGAATYEGDCAWAFGFEDLYGGGDMDFNDVVIRVEGNLKQVN
jgi:hypothetical protein